MKTYPVTVNQSLLLIAELRDGLWDLQIMDHFSAFRIASSKSLVMTDTNNIKQSESF